MKKYIAILFSMFAASSIAQLSFQVIDTTTLHNGTSSSTGLLTAAGLGSNVPYSTTNPAYQFHGDLLPAANAKINGNFTQLASAAVATNATANGQVPIATNTGSGYEFYLGTVASGGAVTATNAIAATNGIGTGTTIVEGISLGATNISVPGVGPNAGTITFQRGLTIEETGPGLTPGHATDSGLVAGYGMGEVSGEIGSVELGSTNDIIGNPFGLQILYGTIGGGLLNFIGNNSGAGYGSYATVAGGLSNNAVPVGSVISGGRFNSINAFANSSVIPGGVSNTVNLFSTNSTAGGSQSAVLYENSWIWNDDSAGVFSNTGPSQFLIHAAGGMHVNTNGGAAALEVNGNGNFTSLSIQGVPVGSATGFLPTINGIGTNETFSSTTTFSEITGLLVPEMSSDTSPYGVASASSSSSTAFNAFTNSTWTSGSESDPWIQYQFPKTVMVNGFVMTIFDGVAANNSLQYSLDGVNWITNYFNTSNPNGVPVAVPPVMANYARIDLNGDGPNISVSSLNFYGGYVNQIAGTSILAITSPFGMSVDYTNVTTSLLAVGGDIESSFGFSIEQLIQLSMVTNYAGANELAINGPINSYGTNAGLFINGVALSDILVAQQNPVYNLSGGIGAAASFNGIYGQWVNAPPYSSANIYLNASGEKFGLRSGWTANSWPSGITSGLYVVFNFDRNQFYTNNSILGTYAAYGNTMPTNSLTISTNITVFPAIQAGQTNVTLIGANTMTVYLAEAMKGTNWIPTMTESGTAIPGFTVTSVTTTNFVSSMTTLTFTGKLWWTAILETQ